MYLKKLHLRNFRNFSSLSVEFGKNANIFLGDNAQGKTNLLEAIYFLSKGRSFRTSTLSDMIFHGEDFFAIEAEIIESGVSQHLSIYYHKKTKKIVWNEKRLHSFHQIFGLLPTIFIVPQDIHLIISSPNYRRRFLNLYIAQFDPFYVHHIYRFWKILKQRNALLKQNRLKNIELYDEQMFGSFMYLTQKRQEAIDSLHVPLKEYTDYFKVQNFSLEYLPSILPEKEIFFQTMKSNQAKELKMKMTLQGPHRDDFLFQIGNNKAKNFASEGQKRLFITLLRFAQWKNLTTNTQKKALLCIDDFAIHLDREKIQKLQKQLTNFSQTFITTPEKTHDWGPSHFFTIKSGKIISQEIT